MARLWTNGFESKHWMSDGQTSASTGPTSYDTTNKRISTTRSSGLFYSDGATAPFGHFSYTSTNGYYYYARTYLRLSTTNPGIKGLVVWRDNNGTAQLQLRTDGADHLQLYNWNTSTVLYTTDAIAANTWYMVETGIMVSGNVAADSYAGLRFNGSLVYESSAQQYGTMQLGGFRFGWLAAPTAAASLWFDDFAINDNQGTDQNSWPGHGTIWLLLPVSDNARGVDWYNNNAGTSNMYDALNNTPPEGLAHSTGNPATAQIYDVVNKATHPQAVMDVDAESYDAAGVPAGETIRLVVLAAVSGTNGTTARNHNAYIASNPAESTPANYTTPAAAAGTYPTNWKYQARTVLYSPTVTRATSPVISLHKEVANVAAILFCYAGITVESVAVETPATYFGMGRAGVALKGLLQPIGRAMLAVPQTFRATGRAILSAPSPTTLRSTGRALLRIQQRLWSTGRMGLGRPAQYMATGRGQLRIAIARMATGRANMSIRRVLASVGRSSLHVKGLWQATGRAIFSAGATTNLRAVGRARMRAARSLMATGRAKLSTVQKLFATGRLYLGLASRRKAVGRAIVFVGRKLQATGRALLRIVGKWQATGRASLRGGVTRRATGRMRYGLDALWQYMGRMRFAILVKRMATGLARVGLAGRRKATGRAILRIRGLQWATGRAKLAVGNITRLFATGRAKMRIARIRQATGRIGYGLASRRKTVGRMVLRGVRTARTTGRMVLRGRGKLQTTGRAILHGKHTWRSTGRASTRGKAILLSSGRALIAVSSKKQATGKSWLVIGVWLHAMGRARLLVRYTVQKRATGRMNVIAPETLYIVFQIPAQETSFAVPMQEVQFSMADGETTFPVEEP